MSAVPLAGVDWCGGDGGDWVQFQVKMSKLQTERLDRLRHRQIDKRLEKEIDREIDRKIDR